MKVNGTAYLVKGGNVKRVMVVAKQWRFSPFPFRQYIVAPIGDEKNIADLLKKAFYGSEPLEVARGQQLVQIPVQAKTGGQL